MLLYEGRLDYPGYHGVPSWCTVQIHGAKPYYVVLFIESDDHTGTSITNRSEVIATMVMNGEQARQYGLTPFNTIFAETYERPERSMFEVSYDLISYEWVRAVGRMGEGPKWKAEKPTWGPSHLLHDVLREMVEEEDRGRVQD